VIVNNWGFKGGGKLALQGGVAHAGLPFFHPKMKGRWVKKLSLESSKPQNF
jgi:hypothetical protein